MRRLAGRRRPRSSLIVVPVLYAIFVLDLKLVKWEERPAPAPIQIGAAEMGGAAAAV
jgi:hypothetical protein